MLKNLEKICSDIAFDEMEEGDFLNWKENENFVYKISKKRTNDIIVQPYPKDPEITNNFDEFVISKNKECYFLNSFINEQEIKIGDKVMLKEQFGKHKEGEVYKVLDLLHNLNEVLIGKKGKALEYCPTRLLAKVIPKEKKTFY